jgi:hypothetical protein
MAALPRDPVDLHVGRFFLLASLDEFAVRSKPQLKRRSLATRLIASLIADRTATSRR